MLKLTTERLRQLQEGIGFVGMMNSTDNVDWGDLPESFIVAQTAFINAKLVLNEELFKLNIKRV